MKSGTIFDNILICDDEEYAKKFGDETWGETKGPEKEMKDEVRSLSPWWWWCTHSGVRASLNMLAR